MIGVLSIITGVCAARIDKPKTWNTFKWINVLSKND
jgi:hypothetical protein